ncbi:hypothetical protein AB1K83_12375 [Sporosarcina sp. 179-K 3D1 HS]|uniref:hypothetical protein n=1 Tax=Sporosarcina sp. 179-K 3D1 HS TaxID=3232169 RepID=UPI0039A18FF7
MVHLQLVTHIDQVKQNLQQYHSELQSGQMSLNTNGVQQWYYVHELGLFGPSRYIGYADITIQRHERAGRLNGGETTQALNKWFKRCDDPELYEKITNKLIDYLSQFDMDIRRNSQTRKPSFKLNLLKEEIPALKTLYLSSTTPQKQKEENIQCQTCQKTFYEEPFFAHHNRGPFCSQKCLPMDVHAEEMASDYINYVENYRESIEAYNEISNVSEQISFIQELEPLLISLEQYTDSELQNEYVPLIQQLAEKFYSLSENAEAYYTDATHLDQQKAIHINWKVFGDEGFQKEQLQDLLSSILEKLNSVEAPFTIMEDTPLAINFTYSNTLYYTSENVSLHTDQVLDDIYVHICHYLNEYDLSFNLHDYVKNTVVAVCPKCCNERLLEHFNHNDVQLFCCHDC